MRGEDIQQAEFFSYGSLEERIPANHPLRPIRSMVDEALRDMSARFDEIYPEEGGRSIPPERLLRALLLQILYSVRSERMLMEQLEYNLLFRWFVGLSADEPVWHPTVFTKNRDRLLEGAVAEQFFSRIVQQARTKKLLSDEHFTVDGTLIEAWAGQKSFQRKDSDPLNPPPPDRSGNPTVNWHRQKRSNQTHASLTDPMARLYKKTHGAEAKLGYLGHALTENRNGLVVDIRLTQATGTAQREAAKDMLSGKTKWRRVTLGGDRAYDTSAFVASIRELKLTPHVTQNNNNRRSAIDERTTRHQGYEISQRKRKRKRVEEVFGWIKTIALQRKTRFRGLERVGWMFTLAASAYNLVRMRNLRAAEA
ncbi:MAG: IS5 family transposase [Acidobacteriota bacterium]|nr:IS5 family transposase [Acidobacteriota bacterium]